MGRILVIPWATVVLACGSNTFDARDATTDTTSETWSFGDGATPLEDVASITLDAGGPFLCFDCVCNGADHFCLEIASGDYTALVLTDAGLDDASMCTADAAYTGCVPIPAQCMAAPSCACIVAAVGQVACKCMLDPSGNGILVGCELP